MNRAQTDPLLEFAFQLQRAETFADVLATTQSEVEQRLGYSRAWLLIADREHSRQLRLVDVAGSADAQAWHRAPVLEVDGDAMLTELYETHAPVVVVDARTDPRTDPVMVARWQNRTLVQVPLQLLDRPLGVFGVGTFGDEGLRPPTDEGLRYLVAMAAQITVAAARILFREDRELAAARLRRTEEALARSRRLEMVGQVAGALAHDFNNLLTVVLGAGSLLECDPGGPDAAELAHEIVAAATQASELTSQLLALSRRAPVRAQLIDPAAIVGSLGPLIRRLVGPQVAVALPGPVARPIRVDPGELKRAVLNLAVNARDAMPNGGRLTLSLADVPLPDPALPLTPARPGPYVLLRVADTGTGMDEATRTRAFDAYFTTKAAGHGTGLGLATVSAVMQEAGGAIAVQSEVGRGSVFLLAFPAADRAVEAAKPVEPVPSRGAATLLIVDDDDAVRRVARSALERAGHRVLQAGGLQAAVALAESYPEPIDVVISEVRLGDGTGADLVGRLTQTRPQLRALLSSADPGEAPTASTRRLPFLAKPYASQALLDAVRMRLDEA